MTSKSPDTGAKNHFLNPWTAAAIFLALIIISGIVFIWVRRDRGQGVEISMPPIQSYQGRISIGGEVNNPGLFPFNPSDTIDGLLKAAGGLSNNADGRNLELSVPVQTGGNSPQKVDINRAAAWLLAALPGIGEGRALAIVDYRTQHGPFRDVNELMKVPGIGTTTFEGIESLITVNK
jgi:competence protein ComEA